MFRVMFDEKYKPRKLVYDKFVNEFPILAGRIAAHKNAFGYEKVSYEMQKKESSIMIGGVLNSLLFDDHISCFSIHDSIFCFRRDSEFIQENKNYSYKRNGICPRFLLRRMINP